MEGLPNGVMIGCEYGCFCLCDSHTNQESNTDMNEKSQFQVTSTRTKNCTISSLISRPLTFSGGTSFFCMATNSPGFLTLSNTT